LEGQFRAKIMWSGTVIEEMSNCSQGKENLSFIRPMTRVPDVGKWRNRANLRQDWKFGRVWNFTYLQSSLWTSHNFMVISRRRETPGFETKEFFFLSVILVAMHILSQLIKPQFLEGMVKRINWQLNAQWDALGTGHFNGQ
jgi:hypothetical protein